MELFLFNFWGVALSSRVKQTYESEEAVILMWVIIGCGLMALGFNAVMRLESSLLAILICLVPGVVEVVFFKLPGPVLGPTVAILVSGISAALIARVIESGKEEGGLGSALINSRRYQSSETKIDL